MARAFLVLSAIFLMGAQASAAPKPEQPMIQYVGSVSINPSHDASVMADWYTRFGIQTQKFSDGGFYGALDTVAGQFFFGIHPRSPNAPAKSSGSVAVVFRVSNYDLYVANAAKNNVVPVSTESDSEGRFAHFVDPDGNSVTIWGR